MKEEGKTSKAPLSEAFGQWKNAKIALLALLGPHRRSGRGLVFGPVLRAVLPAERSQGRRAVGQHHDRHRASPSARSSSSCSAGCRTRSAASRSSWPACARHHDLLPAVQGADLGGQSGAGYRRRKRRRAKIVTPIRGTATSSSTRSARRSSRRRATSRPAS
jgi:hypothetical protein